MDSGHTYFLLNEKGEKTHAVVPLATYESLLALRAMLSAAPLSDHEIYTLNFKGLCASGYPEGGRLRPRFLVIKGSQAVLQVASSLPENIQEAREKLLDKEILQLDPQHNCFVFSADFQFQSPSQAACVISGSVRNGLDVWLNREGFSLKRSGYGSATQGAQTKQKRS